ncbi:hypothetical protein SAMN05216481_11642 [Streptomyces radiopugnans]|uniref:Uncharacterized protein n=1 Tax=Streptomyces radiopugnans TaxID=403935 RepID=A0A1H9J3M1_9ACTN|nr:hypothetical protein [Streptomyces radiopugnans]SEQ81372.1 hypothetical protein SAMN05216481_11642 [Streptomyces radiopugnans]
MPHSSEEPKIHPNVPGPRNTTGTARAPQIPRPSAPVPGPRPGPRPTPQRADRGRPAPGRPVPTRTAGPSHPAAEAKTTPGNAAPGKAAPQIQLVDATEATAVEVADETVDRLLDEGRSPADVLVFTTGEQHPWAQHELTFGEDAYWRQQAEGEDVFYAHASAADRTTGRPVVVLAVNGGTDEQAARALPAALARTGSRLIVCGDPGRLRTLL